MDGAQVRELLRPGAFPHPVGETRLIETHISWVLLTGDYAYKNGWHRVFFAPAPGPVHWFDEVELLRVGWHTVAEVDVLAREQALHAGYEVDVVRALEPVLREAV